MVKSMNVSWWVERWADLRPDKVAVIFGKERITYRRLLERANRTAVWLQSLGIEKGDRVGAMMDNCPQFIELYLASARLGAVFVPINTRLVGPELEFILGHSRPRLFVHGERFSGMVDSLNLENSLPPVLRARMGNGGSERGLDYLTETARLEGQKPFLTSSLGPADPEEPQVIMYTSGTTGQPKGAVLSHRKTFFNCLNADIFFKLHFDDIMLVILPLFHSGGLFIQATPCLYKGATLLIHPRFDPKLAFTDIEAFEVTKFLGVPTIFRALLEEGRSRSGNLSSLRVCAIGGEKTTPELLQECHRAGFSCRQIMGQTETSILLWASEEASLERPGTVGRPVFHAEVRVVDEQGREVEPGQVGEIVAQGSILMKEYWRDPEATERTMVGGWLRTGDLARQDEDGYFYLIDRAKSMYISGGENVYPTEVERVLKTHPGVEDAAVVGIPDQKWGEVGQAYIIPLPGRELTAREVLDFCRERLAGFKQPKKITFLKEFPKTPLGKVRKFLLAQEKD